MSLTQPWLMEKSEKNIADWWHTFSFRPLGIDMDIITVSDELVFFFLHSEEAAESFSEFLGRILCLS